MASRHPERPSVSGNIKTPAYSYVRQSWKNACGYTTLEAWTATGQGHAMTYEEDSIILFFGYVSWMSSKLQHLRTARRILVASDFDGTIAPIVSKPSNARADSAVVAQLNRLAAIPGVIVAVVSGRAMGEMEALCAGFPSCWKIGDHGRSALDPYGVRRADWSPPPDESKVESTATSARVIVERYPGAHMERKSHGVCLHYRNVSEGDLPEALNAIEQWATESASAGFEIQRGRGVVEAQTPGGSKWLSVTKLADLTASEFIVFAGDDTTDLETVASLSSMDNGLGVWVASSERGLPEFTPDIVVEGPPGWASRLQTIADLLENRL